MSADNAPSVYFLMSRGMQAERLERVRLERALADLVMLTRKVEK